MTVTEQSAGCVSDCVGFAYFDRIGDLYDLYRPADPHLTRREIDVVLGASGTPEPGHAVDLMCGQGRHSLELAGRGWQVTAADRTPALLTLLAERAAAHGVTDRISTVQTDVYAGPLAASGASLALLLGNSFGFGADRAAALGLLREVASALAPDGVLALEIFDSGRRTELARRGLAKQHAVPDGTLTKLFDWDPRAETEHVSVVIERSGTRARSCYRQYIPGAPQLIALAEEAGLRSETVLRGPDGWPSDDSTLFLWRRPT